MTMALTKEQREELIARIERAALTCPEQVADWVLDAGASGGMEAAEAELERAIRDNDAEFLLSN